MTFTKPSPGRRCENSPRRATPTPLALGTLSPVHHCQPRTIFILSRLLTIRKIGTLRPCTHPSSSIPSLTDSADHFRPLLSFVDLYVGSPIELDPVTLWHSFKLSTETQLLQKSRRSLLLSPILRQCMYSYIHGLTRYSTLCHSPDPVDGLPLVRRNAQQPMTNIRV